MTNLNDAHVRRIDLNLLWVFQAIMRHRKLAAAAAQLSLTQSAVSHALARLRHAFGDELFLRTGTGVEPTARARELAPPIAQAIQLMADALADPGPFDPAQATGTVRIGMADFEASLLAPRLIDEVRAAAPGLTLSIRSSWRRLAPALLHDGELDLAVGFFPERAEDIERAALFVEDYRVVAREGHPALAGGLSLDSYLAAGHVLVSGTGDARGVADAALARLGRQRQVVSTLPYFLPALLAVAGSDLLATVPSRLALTFGPRLGLAVAPPPLALRPFTVSAIWHRRDRRSRLRGWMVERIAGLV